MFIQVSSERKSDTGKENVTKGEQSGRVSSKKGQKTASLARPVSLKLSWIVYFVISLFPFPLYPLKLAVYVGDLHM